jgi:hypothetical protein
MKRLIELLAMVLLGVPWLAGIVLAKGFWLTTAAIFLPPSLLSDGLGFGKLRRTE